MTQEKSTTALSGWIMLPLVIGAVPGTAWLFIEQMHLLGALTALFFILASVGFFTIQPNEAKVLTLFGRYIGTVQTGGFYWANPFFTKKPISKRLRNFNSEVLKVNDQRGNPIEIGIVVVWRVTQTAQAVFDVDDYEQFVKIQSEAAIRHLAAMYPYDHMEDESGTITLRSGGDKVAEALAHEIQERLSKAGVQVEEARLSHLAYAQEIAGAMLKRQQAEAVIAARRLIVQGAVSMVEMALHELDKSKMVSLDEERKAAMVSNLLVVLCGETEAQPVINTGTLHH
jgi:regulator of protease activity HflC (stomatin/prohibitin superfamily)